MFVFGYDRFDSMTTSKMLNAESIDHTVLVHTEEARQRFIEHGTAQTNQCIATGNPKGLAYQRNTALDMMQEGEWAMFLVDDLRQVSELRNYDRVTTSSLPITQQTQSHYAKRFDNPITLTHFMHRAQELVTRCETYNCHLGGFCGIDNPLYRRKHWSYNVLADGRAWVVRKTHLRFDENVQTIDDYAFTCDNINAFGLVIVNQWVLPDCRRYSTGGYGTLNDRMQQKIRDAQYLVNKYPHLVMYKDKAGHQPNSHITIRQRNKPRHLMHLR